MQAAIEGKWPVTSVQDFFDLVLSDMVKSGAINGFFTFVHANARTVEPSTAGGGGSSGGGGSFGGGSSGGGGSFGGGSSGGGGAGDVSGVPVHVGPEGDAYLDPNVSTGVPQYVGPGGDLSVAPGTVSGVPEYIGPGTEPTQPMGTAYEPTEPAPAAGGPPYRAPTLGDEEPGPRTAAEAGVPGPRTGTDEGADEMSWAEELRGVYRPQGLKAMVVDHAVADPVELTQLVSKANAYGARVIRVDGTTPQGAARLDQLWRTSYAQQGAAPTAWVDTFGNIVVDEAAHPEINTATALQGPVREPEGGPQQELDNEGEGEGGAFGRHLFDRAGPGHPGPRRGKPCVLGRDRGPPPGGDDQGPGHLPLYLAAPVRTARRAPPAFYDAAGTLHVDINRVDIQTSPR